MATELERKTKELRGALFGYLSMLAGLSLRERIENDAAFKAVRAGLLHGGAVLQLTRREADIVRAYLLNEQYNTCKLSGQKLTPAGAVLDHCHSTGRVRGVLARAANGYLDGHPATGNLRRKDPDTLRGMADGYRRTTRPIDLLYPRNR